MKSFSIVCVMLLSATTAMGQSSEVNQAEILRLGNMVQHVDGQRHGQNVEDALVEAMKPPADDSDKWFISVLVSRSCTACQKLRRDWAADPSLQALADPGDPKRSWAHLNFYYAEDKSQAFRFKGIQVDGYPTVIVQPPRNKEYGDPTTVVHQGTYDGNPRHLAGDIARSIRMYVGKLVDAEGASHTSDIALPWQPAPKDDRPDGRKRLIPPLVPDEVAIQIEFPWKAILALLTAGFSIPAIIALVIWVLVFVRSGRKAAGKPMLLDDATFEKLVGTLEQLAESQKKPTRAKRTTAKK